MYVSSQKNSRCCFSVFVIFGLCKIRKIQFLQKYQKWLIIKFFYLHIKFHKILIKMEINHICVLTKKFKVSFCLVFGYFGMIKRVKFNFCQKEQKLLIIKFFCLHIKSYENWAIWR